MEHFFKQLKENYVIIVFIVGLIVTWTTFNSRLSQAELDIKDLKTAVAEITNIKITVERIDTSVDFIKKQVIK